MAGKAELGKAFLDELVAKLPADKQEALRTTLSSPEAVAALEHAGSRLSPLDEERQRLDETRTRLTSHEQRLTDWQGRLGAWKTDTEKALGEREQQISTREAGGGPPANQQLPANGSTVTKEEVAKLIQDIVAPREAGYVAYVADATRFASFHQLQFKEPLDVSAIVRNPKIGELGFEGVYREMHKEKLDKYAADQVAADRAKLKDELRRELVSESPVDMPYPLGEGSPLDVLSMDPAQRPKGDPATAARMYEQAVAANRG